MLPDSRREPLEDRALGAATVLLGAGSGKYPDANAAVVRGAEETMLLDVPLGVRRRLLSQDPSVRAPVTGLDRILLTHAHEDHAAALDLLSDLPIALHEFERGFLDDIDTFIDIFGMAGERRDAFRARVEREFHFMPRPDALTFRDGERFDLGGGVTVEVILTPGHTPGHSCFLIEPAGLLFLADIDLSSFGPYYGDRASSLEAFEKSVQRVAEIDCHAWLSGHHIGLIEDPNVFAQRLERYAGRFKERDERLLLYLAEPRTMGDVARHRFVYRPQDEIPGIEQIEHKMMGMHLERLIARGQARETDEGRFVRSS